MRCSYCGSHKHTLKLCPKTSEGSVNRLHLRCSYCGSRKHEVQACLGTHAGSAARAWYPEKVADHFIKD